ncbi:MAG: class I SAM-dependent methyltransferase [SAR86 cluster bacterium]|jgi:ubiquinone/menaquinone biosynthesis C-methylase UbiE|nr:class I SAM-dependent methyltransferase [SAR86 cluster bacterium]|tara:strand:- start:9777 stop:10397 length:621 start_codon:yes stop_codon:yes gene_type:complete
MKIYEKYVLPKLLNFTCGLKPMRHQREKVVPLAKGEILEIGIGSGLNIPFYKTSGVKRIWGLDPSEELNVMAKKVADQSDLEVKFLLSGAEQIPLPSNSIDTILITYTLCTIPEVEAAVKEMNRVLRPEGELIFCEHGRSPDENILKWQDKINPYWNVIGGGCNVNRDIPRLIESAGFSIRQMESMYLPGTPKVLGFNYWGSARLL